MLKGIGNKLVVDVVQGVDYVKRQKFRRKIQGGLRLSAI